MTEVATALCSLQGGDHDQRENVGTQSHSPTILSGVCIHGQAEGAGRILQSGRSMSLQCADEVVEGKSGARSHWNLEDGPKLVMQVVDFPGTASYGQTNKSRNEPSRTQLSATPCRHTIKIHITAYDGNLYISERVTLRLFAAPTQLLFTGATVNLHDDTGSPLYITRVILHVTSFGRDWVTFRLSEGMLGVTETLQISVPSMYTERGTLLCMAHRFALNMLGQDMPDVPLPLPRPTTLSTVTIQADTRLGMLS